MDGTSQSSSESCCDSKNSTTVANHSSNKLSNSGAGTTGVMLTIEGSFSGTISTQSSSLNATPASGACDACVTAGMALSRKR